MSTFRSAPILPLLLLVAAHGRATAAPDSVAPRDWSSYTFEQFVNEFDRAYEAGSLEWQDRASLFSVNLESILAQNEAYAQGRSLWFAGVNNFTDWSAEEMRALRGFDDTAHKRRLAAEADGVSGTFGSSRHQHYQKRVFVPRMRSEDLPKSVDWRTKGVVSAPKSQGGCGSCWAFSTAESVESHVAIATGKLLDLAPQELVSCMSNPNECGGTGGCDGATAILGFAYTAAHGLAAEKDYPYQGKATACSTSASPAAYVNGSVIIPKNNATALMEAVATVGPISISAAAKTWGFYFGGIFDGSLGAHCDVDVDHAVQLVGYGSDAKLKKDYWLVRNSWGPKFGEDGYIRILRTPGNEPCADDPRPLDGGCGKSGPCKCPSVVRYCGTCGILSESAYPLGARLA